MTTSGSAAQAEMPGVEVRRLWADSYRDFYASSISPDGRYLSMVDWSTTDLAVRDLQTGVLHRLTNAVREEGAPWEDAGVSVFSRDGRRIVVGWQYAPDLQLRVIDIETDPDGTARPVASTVMFYNPEYYPYYPFDWSPDGHQVLAKVYASGSTSQLALISMDGTYEALKSFDWREPTMAEFSADGRYVAYDFLPEQDSSNRDVFVMSIDGTQDTRIVDWPGVDRLLGWHPDGSVLFHSDHGGSPGVWRVPVAEGRATGSAELVKADMWGVEPLGFAGDRFYYGLNVNPERLYTVAVDLDAGRTVGVPTPVADPAEVQIRGWDWSPDGEFLAYSGSVLGAQGSRIGIQRDTGEEVRGFQLGLSASRRMRWHPDGRSLVVFGRDDKGRRGFHRVDLEAGTYRTILYTETAGWSSPRGNFAISPDGGTLYFTRLTPEVRVRHLMELVAYDLASGDIRVVARVSAWGFGPVALSPDGSRLAVIEPENVLATIPVDGGPVHELEKLPHDLEVPRLEWAPDGRSIVYRAYRTDPWEENVYVRDVDGGARRSLDLGEGVSNLLRVHPGGRRIAYLAGESRGEVWVMEGISPQSGAIGDSGRPR